MCGHFLERMERKARSVAELNKNPTTDLGKVLIRVEKIWEEGSKFCVLYIREGEI